MIHWLIYGGLAVISFIWIPGRADPVREPKMAWTVLFALLIGLYALWKGKLKPFSNKFAIGLIFYIFVAYYLSPQPDLIYFGIRSARFWSWEPMFYSMTFLLFLMTVSSMKFTRKEMDILLDVMVWCGAIMAGLVCLQSFHIMQFFEHRFGTYGNMGGLLGNPTLVGPYLGIILPLALYRKRYPAAVLITYSLIATCSQVAWAGLIVSMCFYIGTKSKKLFISTFIALSIATTVVVVGFATSQKVREILPDNQRFDMLSKAIYDVRNPVMKDSNGDKSKKVYTVTGLGIGSFKYLFHAFHNNGFVFLHNEYGQCFYELGIIGFLLFMAALIYGFVVNFSIKRIFAGTETRYKRAIMTSMVCSCVCAGGIFIWQFGTTIYFTLIVFGLLHNPYNEKIGD